MSKAQCVFIAVLFCVEFLLGFWAGTIATGEVVEKEYITKYRYIYTEGKQPEVEYESLGVFEATAYCNENYPHICNDGDATKTATGTTPTAGRTIAVDPDVIPYGTEIIINGQVYVAEDTGGAIKGNKVDILFATHEEALQFGRQNIEVFASK